ncbi:MAG: hypothetical protein U0Q22_15585 [Acidimicrobiales bacterium]
MVSASGVRGPAPLLLGEGLLSLGVGRVGLVLAKLVARAETLGQSDADWAEDESESLPGGLAILWAGNEAAHVATPEKQHGGDEDGGRRGRGQGGEEGDGVQRLDGDGDAEHRGRPGRCGVPRSARSGVDAEGDRQREEQNNSVDNPRDRDNQYEAHGGEQTREHERTDRDGDHCHQAEARQAVRDAVVWR